MIISIALIEKSYQQRASSYGLQYLMCAMFAERERERERERETETETKCDKLVMNLQE